MTPFERLILDILADRAMTGFEIARTLDRRIPGALSGREGILYPALMALERRSAVVTEWEIREEGRRRLYRLTPAATPSPSSEESDGDA